MRLRTPAGPCPRCGQPVGAEEFEPTAEISGGGWRIQAVHRWASSLDRTGDAGGMGCGGRVRLYVAPDRSTPDGWEADRS